MPLARRSLCGAAPWWAIGLLGRALGATERTRWWVAVQPLGETGALEQDQVLRAVRGTFGVEVKALSAVALPQEAYYSPRRRYRAERLVDWLIARRPVGGGQVLGVTCVDVSTTKGAYDDWGVLGLARIGGTAGVISSFRCGRGARSPAHKRQRLAKVAVHELGHTFGLEHCPTHGCLMEDAGGKIVTVDRETAFCDRCRAFLLARGLPLPATPAPL